MAAKPGHLLPAILLLVITTLGCSGPNAKQLAIKAAVDQLNCPEKDLQAEWIDVRRYRVEGCSSSAVFVCSTSKESCKRDDMGPFWD